MTVQPPKYSIDVRVETMYLDTESRPQQDHFVFAYTITIFNSGLVAAKLLTRHWFISNAEGKTYEVQGEGVVGEQPYLKPGEAYQYTSGTVLDTPVGTMQGSYQLIADDGQVFEAVIAPFTLAVPNKLH
ncbi:MAG: Co2+/Mg2+ efflux protein ApaG [Gammaproteobacteria bacterium RIFCSPHIGHO2_12_FULL_35_23]|nr:MAG: Co2+/Mg2+ efflux protein ApaG [Gammaproteobacteria bacterium RIFCSPHIGHO2_12_FULL_35_23]